MTEKFILNWILRHSKFELTQKDMYRCRLALIGGIIYTHSQ